MNGCECYIKKAKAARRRIYELETERSDYDDLNTAINALKPQVDKYKTFFADLGSALEAVVISGKTFDDGKCSQMASSLGDVRRKLNDITTEILSAKGKINKDISDQNAIINNVFYCSYCKAKDEAAAATAEQAVQ